MLPPVKTATQVVRLVREVLVHPVGNFILKKVILTLGVFILSSEMQRMSVAQSCSEFEPNETIMRGFMAAQDISCSYCDHWSNEEDECLLNIFDSQLMSLDQT